MLEEYIFKTIISFISLNAIIFMSKDNWLKLNPKRNGFVRKYFNRLAPCLVPVFRWIYIVIFLVLSIALGDDDFVKMYKEKHKGD